MLFEPLFAHAARTPGLTCIIDEHGQYSYQQVATMAAGMGLYLAAATQRPHVGILLPPGVGYVAAFYGTLLAGKAVVPLNYLLGDREIAHVLANSGIDTVVTIPQLAGRLKDSPLKIVDLTQLPQSPAGIAPRFPSPRADDMAVLMYTSGTSGLPKGVVLTYRNLQSDVDAAIEHAALREKHKFLGIIPLFHSFGMTATILAPIQLGSTAIYLQRFSAVATLKAIKEHKASIMLGVPSMFAALLHLKSATAADFAHFYLLISGGEPLSAAVRKGFEERFGITIHEGYGLTETCAVAALNTPQMNRPGSVGKPLPNVQTRIISDEGLAVGPDGEGEIWIKGPMIMKEYFHLPNETASALTADGFFKTGDCGKLDADGFLYVTGRKKELIIVAGEKAAPREIEEMLLLHPEVLDAAVVGKKDPHRGEIVVAFIIARPQTTPTSESLRDFCRQKQLATFKVPREIHFVSEFPRTPTGKVLKRVLAEKLNA